MNNSTFGGMARLAALLFVASLFLAGCQTTPSAGSSSNYKEVFPGTGMPDFPDGSA